MAHRRQARPYSGLGFKVNVLETFLVVPWADWVKDEELFEIRVPRRMWNI